MFKNDAGRRLIAIDVRVTGKNENMQADVQSIQSTHHLYCPLCHAPLVTRTGDGAIGISDRTSSSHVFCASCGYAGPVMSRQHAVPSRSRHRTPKSAVWIDPAVSTYLQGEQIEQSSPTLSPPVEPTTPIPPRASAQRLRAVNVRLRYSYIRVQESEESDLADVPTVPPPTTWQYDSQAYAAESSVSTLSLIVDTPTHPQTPTPVMPTMPDTPPHGMPRIEEIATRPPAIAISKSTVHGSVDSTINEPPRAIEEQNTMPMQLSPAPLHAAQLPTAASLFLSAPAMANNVANHALAPVALTVLQTVPTVLPPQSRQVASAEPVSWTAGDAAGSRYAQLVAARTRRQKSGLSFNIFDRVRWWLLHPGRFEFLMWLSGTLLLVAVTCIFILLSAFSFQWNGANANNGATSSFNGTNGQTPSPGLSLALTNADPLVADQPLHLRGQGFSANGHIALTYDAGQPFLNQKGQALVAQADAHGAFVVTLTSPAWGTGQHRIVARDLATGHLATVLVTVVASAKMATATSAVTTPVTAATAATTTQQGNNTPPVGQTPPVVPTSTAGITPTTTPGPPTPTPTVGITPTATVGTTPTVGVTATPKLGETATVGTTATVGNTNPAMLNAQYVATSGKTAVPGGPWLWLLMGGYALYALAMLLFGLAGLVHNGHKRSSGVFTGRGNQR